jgi:hypothetical protein
LIEEKNVSAETEMAVIRAFASIVDADGDNDNEQNDAGDIEDALFEHYGTFGRWDWCEITNETRRIWNLLFVTEVENGSPMDYVWAAAIAQAYYGGVHAAAASLGLDKFGFQHAIAPWAEHQDAPPPPITAEELIRRCEGYVIARSQREAARKAKGVVRG